MQRKIHHPPPSLEFVVCGLHGYKLHLVVHRSGGDAAVPDFIPEHERKGLLEGLAETGAHEAVDDGVDGGVGVGHAVGPGFDFVGGVVGLEPRVEALEQAEELDGAPADGEEQDDDDHHLRDFTPHGDGPLRQELHLVRKERTFSIWKEGRNCGGQPDIGGLNCGT